MNKKIIAAIILVVVMAGAYASYYAYASMVMVPEDLKIFESELESLSSPAIHESELKELEESSRMIENFDALSLASQSERNNIAEIMISENENFTSEMQEFRNNFTNNREISQRYDLMLKGDVANEIRSAYNYETLDLIDKIKNNTDKQAEDIKKGDSKAYANDVREFVKLAKKLNENLDQTRTHLQNVVNELGG